MSMTKLATVASEQVFLLASPAVAAEMEHAFPSARPLEAASDLHRGLQSVLVGDSVELFQPAIRESQSDEGAREDHLRTRPFQRAAAGSLGISDLWVPVAPGA